MYGTGIVTSRDYKNYNYSNVRDSEHNLIKTNWSLLEKIAILLVSNPLLFSL
jgi:hypothetical protein